MHKKVTNFELSLIFWNAYFYFINFKITKFFEKNPSVYNSLKIAYLFITLVFLFLFFELSLKTTLYLYIMYPFLQIIGILFFFKIKFFNIPILKINNIDVFQYLILTSGFFLIFSIYILKYTNQINLKEKIIENIIYLNLEFFSMNIYLDSLNIFFLILTNILNFTTFIYLSKFNKNIKKTSFFCIFLLITLIILNFLFLTNNFFVFYIFFEIILIPFLFIIAIWGARTRKIHAAIQFFIFTLFSSMFVLILIIYMFEILNSLDIKILNNYSFKKNEEKIIWILFFLGLSAKIPIIPFHFWLPEAHVEAPTIGSVILAGILLKLGGYGFIKFLISYTIFANFYFYPIISIIGSIGLIYGSLSTLRQIDLKKIVAYSSIVHMNYSILGLFSNELTGIIGSYFMMLTHGLIASAFFFSIGFLYERYHSRILKYFKGLNNFMPIFTFFFFLLTLNNAGFPLTASFIGEFFIFLSITKISLNLTLITSFGLILTCIYAFWFFTRLFYGTLKKNNVLFLCRFNDITLKESLILFIYVYLSIFLLFNNNIIFENITTILEYNNKILI